ncbi:MAG TPA: EI24 domain-containing protein [Chitinophagaceae bacterium]|nr:EI24 domain-containing protein [Chitinophagaceae bacterium]
MFSFREVIRAIRCYGLAHTLIRRQRLLKWILLPGLMFMGLFSLGTWLVWIASELVTTDINSSLGVSRWIQRLESGWVSFFFILLGLSVRLVFFSFFFSLLKYLLVIVLAPYFERMASLTESFINPMEPRPAQQLHVVQRAATLAARNGTIQTIVLGILLVLSFIPVAGWVTPLVCFVVECYYFGFAVLDHACRLHRLSYSQSINFISDHRGLAIGNGLVFYLFMFIPVAGWILGPGYAMVAATISLRQKS